MSPQDEDESDYDSVSNRPRKRVAAKKQSPDAKPKAKPSAAGTKTSQHRAAGSSPRGKTDALSTKATESSLVTRTHPADNDVRCGRGIPVHNYPGNARFHAILNSHREDYLKIPRTEKSKFIKKIVREVKQKGLRFLNRKSKGIRDGGDEGSYSGDEEAEWEEMGDAFVYEKISHGLRRRDPQNVRTSKAAKSKADRQQAALLAPVVMPFEHQSSQAMGGMTVRAPPGVPSTVSVQRAQEMILPAGQSSTTDIGMLLGLTRPHQEHMPPLQQNSQQLLYRLHELAQTQQQVQQSYQVPQVPQAASSATNLGGGLESLLLSISVPPATQPAPPHQPQTLQVSLPTILSALFAQQHPQQQQQEQQSTPVYQQGADTTAMFLNMLMNMPSQKSSLPPSSNTRIFPAAGPPPQSMNYPTQPLNHATIPPPNLKSLLPGLLAASSGSAQGRAPGIADALMTLLHQATTAPPQQPPPQPPPPPPSNTNNAASALHSALLGVLANRSPPATVSSSNPSSVEGSVDLQEYAQRALQDILSSMNRSSGGDNGNQDRRDFNGGGDDQDFHEV